MPPSKPYNPATSGPQVQVHDRRAKSVNRGLAAHIVETEVDDPFERGARIATVRSVRDDPLADRLARGHIDAAQFAAGREFQKHFGIAERGPRAIQLTERVDGSAPPETLSDSQLRSWRWLDKCYRKLGDDGSALVHDVLVRNMTVRQIAQSRGLAGSRYESYFGIRLRECLDELAIVFGFVSAKRPTPVTASPASPRA